MTNQRSGSEAEFVVTLSAPDGAELVAQAGARTTLGVLTELLASARHRLVIGAPFIQGAEGLHANPLGVALMAALKRGVCLDLVSTGASLAELDLAQLKCLARNRLRTFQPRTNIEDVRVLGSHAKFCLADGCHAYIGSANITQKGIAAHLEMGILLHGRLARQVWIFVERLFESDYFVEVEI